MRDGSSDVLERRGERRPQDEQAKVCGARKQPTARHCAGPSTCTCSMDAESRLVNPANTYAVPAFRLPTGRGFSARSDSSFRAA